MPETSVLAQKTVMNSDKEGMDSDHKKRNRRRALLKGLAIGTIALPIGLRLFGPQTVAQRPTVTAPGLINSQQYRWKMVTTWPPNFPVLGEGASLFADLVRSMSGGRLDIQVFAAGELVPPMEVFDTVSRGVAEVGHSAAYYWAGKIPAAQLFTAVPFGMNAQQTNAWLNAGGGLQLWQELYAPYGLVPMPAGNTGVQMGGWFNREINSIADFKGLKIRIAGLGGKVLKKAGASPLLLAGGEIYTGLERGVIDATEWIGPFHDRLMGFQKIAKYYYAPAWQEPGPILELLFNKRAYDQLPSDLRAILVAAANSANDWMLPQFEVRNAQALYTMLEEDKVNLRIFPEPVLQQLREYSKEVLEELAASDPKARLIYDSYRTFQDQMLPWAEISEKRLYNLI